MQDVVYIVGPQPVADDIELRYSLRSLVNLPHGKVWIVGRKPIWLQGVYHIPTAQKSTKYENARNNIIAACRDPRVSAEFILMNDDFFVLSPQVPIVYDRGDLGEAIEKRVSRGTYHNRLVRTLAALREVGITKPKSYEVHIPTVFNAARLLALIDEGLIWHDLLLRTMYYNLIPQPSIYREDVKRGSLTDIPADYLSTSNGFAKDVAFQQYIHKRFPEPCYHEKV